MTTAVAEQADAVAFAAFVAAHRSELHRHCQRILRSPERAEDALQEALLRAWRARAGFAGNATLRTWLRRIATNACFDELRRSRCVVVTLDGNHHDRPDPAASLEAELEAKEALQRAMLAVMALLPPRQRAVLVLRGVLGYPAVETAHLLGTTAPAVNSALQRARAAMQATPTATGLDPADGPVLRAYVDALAAHDAARVVAVARRDVGG